MTAISCELTAEQRETLTGMVADWIGEGFTRSYTSAHYDIFEWLGLATYEGDYDYDTRRPANPSEAP